MATAAAGGGATAMPTQMQVAALGTATVAQLHRLTLNPREVYQAAAAAAAGGSLSGGATTPPRLSPSAATAPAAAGAPSPLGHGGAVMTETTDVFLAGQTLFYVFSGGCFPFVDVNARDAQASHVAAVMSGAEPYWEYLSPFTPPAVVALLAWMLEHDPARRPSIRCVCARWRGGSHPAASCLPVLVRVPYTLACPPTRPFLSLPLSPADTAAWWWSTPRSGRLAS
jgi:hypothetical protein